MPALGASTAADSTAWCSDTGKHIGVVSSILGASLEPAQHRYNKSTLCSREETTEREYCCKKRMKEISTGPRNPTRYSLQTKPYSVSPVLFFLMKSIFIIFFSISTLWRWWINLRNHKCPNYFGPEKCLRGTSESAQGQVGWGFERPGPLDLELDDLSRSLPTHDLHSLWFHDLGSIREAPRWGSPHLLRSGCWCCCSLSAQIQGRVAP